MGAEYTNKRWEHRVNGEKARGPAAGRRGRNADIAVPAYSRTATIGNDVHSVGKYPDQIVVINDDIARVR